MSPKNVTCFQKMKHVKKLNVLKKETCKKKNEHCSKKLTLFQKN